MDNQMGKKTGWVVGLGVVAIGLQPNSTWRPVMRRTEASIPGPALFSILIRDLEELRSTLL